VNNILKLLLAILLIISCRDNEYIFYPDLDEDYRRLLRISENEFKAKLEAEYKGSNHYKNLAKYLQSMSQEDKETLVPSENLKKHIERGTLVSDIWNKDKSFNTKGKFFNCISKSKSEFLKEYCSRIQTDGNLAPTVIAEGILNYIDEHGKDEYIFPIATINFYVITLN